MNTERKHHEFSPSTLQNLEACSSWEGTQTNHPRAIAGTMVHTMIETGEDNNEVSDDDAEMAAECADFYSQRKQLLEASGPVTELSEEYLPIDAEETTAGYFDKAIIDCAGTYCEAMDWKTGKWKVTECKNNLQGAAYCLGLFRRFPKLESIRFFFLQPALNFVSEALFTRDQIPELYLRVKVVVARAREARSKKDFATARPAVAVCLFCRNLAACPKVSEFALKVGKKFSPLQIPESVTPSMALDPQQTGLAMKLAQVLGVWADAIKATTADRVLRGASPLPEGYELRSREGSRKVVDPIAFKAIVLEILTDEELEATKKISLGAVETAIGTKSPRGFKKEAIQKFRADVEAANAVEKGSGAVYLQAEND